MKRTIDGVGESQAVSLHELERAARLRVDVGAAARDEERGCARVGLFERSLGNTRVVAVRLHERVLKRGVVADVAEDDRNERAVGAVDPEDGNRVIDRDHAG